MAVDAKRGKAAAWLLIFFAVAAWSAIHPKDTFTWVLEVFPAFVALGVLFFTYRRFPLTDLTYGLILLHCLVLFVGGHYTYAEVPLFDWIRDALRQDRNNYDKVGHFIQGFVPAIIAREILARRQVVKGPGWRFFLVFCICTTISALYEMLEWGTALLSGENADAFLGTQGYVWDTQSDILLAMTGSLAALVLLGRLHDRQLNDL